MASNRQNSAKNIRKIDFPYNNFPKKDISFQKCTKKEKNAFDEKKSTFFSRLRRDGFTLPPGLYESGPAVQRPSYMSLPYVFLIPKLRFQKKFRYSKGGGFFVCLFFWECYLQRPALPPFTTPTPSPEYNPATAEGATRILFFEYSNNAVSRLSKKCH